MPGRPGQRNARDQGALLAPIRALAEVADGQPLIGTGNLGSRVWSGPGT